MRTRAALIGAAQSFMAAGKLNVPVLEITQAADVGMGSFYNHFDSKEQLFQAAINEVLDAHGALLDRLTGERRGSRRDVRPQLPPDGTAVPAPPGHEPRAAQQRAGLDLLGPRGRAAGAARHRGGNARPDGSPSTIRCSRSPSRAAR